MKVPEQYRARLWWQKTVFIGLIAEHTRGDMLTRNIWRYPVVLFWILFVSRYFRTERAALV